MRLLILRPEPDASETAARLAALGHSVLTEPMLTVVFNPPPAEGRRPAAILITSRNGVRALGLWPAAAGWHEVPVYAVGSETAAAARDAGFRHVRTGEGDGDALVGLVAAAQSPVAGRILYPAARDRAADIDAALATRGYAVDLVKAYRAEPAAQLSPTARKAIAEGQVDGALFFSRRTAIVFRKLVTAAGLERALGELVFYVLSAAVAEPLRGLTAAAIRVADRPEADRLFALLPPGD